MIKVLDTRKVFASATASQGEYEASDKFGIGLQSWQAALAQKEAQQEPIQQPGEFP